jgi:hypothetical protein
MMPMTRQEIEILLDSPDLGDYVVTAYADMTVKSGFMRDVDLHLRNEARVAAESLSGTRARKDLEANIDLIRQALAEHADTPAQGLAVFTSIPRGLRHVVPLDFEVENLLIIDDEPFLLPLLERWYGEPACLAVLVDSDQAHLFSAHRGHPDWVRDLERRDAAEAYQRDKPRFTYKKRFARAQHERLRSTDEDRFLHEVCQAVVEEWGRSHFADLILLGQPPITAALRRLLPRELLQSLAGETPHAMTSRPEDISDDVGRILEQKRSERERELVAELRERWRRDYLVGTGPTEVLDALQQGRAGQVLFGNRRDIEGARCAECHYLFGTPLQSCVHCGGVCRKVNAAQEILRMAVRHRVPVHFFRGGLSDDPLAAADCVAAFLLAPANWAPPVATTLY